MQNAEQREACLAFNRLEMSTARDGQTSTGVGILWTSWVFSTVKFCSDWPPLEDGLEQDPSNFTTAAWHESVPPFANFYKNMRSILKLNVDWRFLYAENLP